MYLYATSKHPSQDTLASSKLCTGIFDLYDYKTRLVDTGHPSKMVQNSDINESIKDMRTFNKEPVAKEPVYWNDFTLWDTTTRYSRCGQKSYSINFSRSSVKSFQYKRFIQGACLYLMNRSKLSKPYILSYYWWSCDQAWIGSWKTNIP